LPESFGNFTNIREINLTGNRLTEILNSLVKYLRYNQNSKSKVILASPTGFGEPSPNQGQTGTLPLKKLEKGKINRNAILPKLILQLNDVYSSSVKGTMTVTKDGNMKTFTLEDILSGATRVEDVFDSVGAYDIILETEKSNQAPLNTKYHKYTYTIEVAEPVNPLAGVATSTNGNYKVALSAIVKDGLNLPDGEHVLSSDQISNYLVIRGITQSLASGKTANRTNAQISSAKMKIEGGKATSLTLMGNAAVSGQGAGIFVMTMPTQTKPNHVFSISGLSKDDLYGVSISGSLPGNLQEGKNVFAGSDLLGLPIWTLAYHKGSNGQKIYNTNVAPPISMMEITVTKSKVNKIVCNGTVKVGSNPNKAYTITAEY